MKNSHLNKINYQNEKNQKFPLENNQIKTTDVNILLNRVRQQNKSKKKKIIILSTSIISFILIIILAFGN